MKKEKMRQEKDDIHDRPPNLSFKQSAKGVRLLNSSLSVLICVSKHEIAQLMYSMQLSLHTPLKIQDRFRPKIRSRKQKQGGPLESPCFD